MVRAMVLQNQTRLVLYKEMPKGLLALPTKARILCLDEFIIEYSIVA
jgi:hypothetical protein